MNHKTLAIVGACVIVLASLTFAWLYFKESAVSTVEFVSATGTSWYRLSGDTLALENAPAGSDVLAGPSGAQASAALVPPGHFTILLQQGGVEKNLGAGRPLGFLPGGALLALTPLGVSRVTADGTAFPLAGTRASTTPIGAAAADLSVIAFADPVSGSVLVYRFDTQKNSSTLLGTVSLPSLPSSALSADEMQQALGRAGLETTGSDKTLTAEQAIKLSAEIQNAPSYRRLAMPDAIGYARDTVYVRTYAGAFYAILLTSQGPGVPRLLTVAQK